MSKLQGEDVMELKVETIHETYEFKTQEFPLTTKVHDNGILEINDIRGRAVAVFPHGEWLRVLPVNEVN